MVQISRKADSVNMKTLLLATDLNANSDRAFERALKLAKEKNAKLIIFHVTSAFPDDKRKKWADYHLQNAEELIRSFLSEYEESKLLDVSIEVVPGGEPFSLIIEKAHSCDADLILMGLHGKSKFMDLFLGTTVARVMRKGMKPILMVRNKPIGAYRKIISGIDFSVGARAALRTAMSLSPTAHFHLFHAFDIPVTVDSMALVYSEMHDVTENAHKKSFESFIQAEKEFLIDTYGGISAQITSKLEQGEAASLLIQHTRNYEAELLTIGGHGKQDFLSAAIGGTAEYILSHPPCDVLVAKDYSIQA